MRLKKGPWDGAQPRTHVLAVLRDHGVRITEIEADLYELLDCDGDPLVLSIPNPVLSSTIEYLYRRFGHSHQFEITDLVKRH